MAEEESILERMKEKFDGSSSSSDSDHEEKKPNKIASPPPASLSPESSSFKSKVKRIFGREKPPVHKALGGGKPADVFLWRNKKISAGVLGGATVVWVLFEVLEFHLLSVLCTCLIVALAGLFLWSNAHSLIYKSPPRIPEVHIPEEPVLQFAAALRFEVNRGFDVLKDIASGKDLKKFLMVIALLWILAIVGSCGNFLTFFYVAFVMLHTLPLLYEKYEDRIDAFAEKAMVEIKKQYAVFDAKVLSKIPRGPLKDKKQA